MAGRAGQCLDWYKLQLSLASFPCSKLLLLSKQQPDCSCITCLECELAWHPVIHIFEVQFPFVKTKVKPPALGICLIKNDIYWSEISISFVFVKLSSRVQLFSIDIKELILAMSAVFRNLFSLELDAELLVAS